jgi:hypothetical protein
MKKTKFTIILTFLAITLLFSSCIFVGPSIKGNGHVTTETREIGDFNKIKVSTGLHVVLVQSDRELVTVEADENLHAAIRTEIKRNELNIFTDERIRKAKMVQLTVEFTDLDQLKSSSGSHVGTDGTVKVKKLATTASSGSHQSLNIVTQTFSAKTSSGAHLAVDGKAEDASLKASSGSHLKAGGLSSENCTADVSSGAHIYIDVAKDFDGEASSGGQIYYSGNPKSVTINTSSGGNIRKQ